jgi:anti-sigma regulatory factor (Ser/Thr protein kinase)
MPVETPPPDQSAPGRWERECASEPACVPQLRRGVTEFARLLGAGDTVVRDLALAVSEAVTNAVLHAFVDRAPGRIRVVCEPGPETLLVRVLDDGRGMMPRSDSPGLGLGLPMIGQFTTSLDIREGLDGRGTEVRMAFAAPGIIGPPLEADRRRFELLAAVGGLAAAAGWPGEGLQRLVELLVPEVAEACAIDLIDDGQGLRRVAARVHGDRGRQLTSWLAGRLPRPEQAEQILSSLRAGETRIVAMDEEGMRAAARDQAEAGLMASLDVAAWVNLPLRAGDQLLGSLGLGLSRSRGPEVRCRW